MLSLVSYQRTTEKQQQQVNQLLDVILSLTSLILFHS